MAYTPVQGYSVTGGSLFTRDASTGKMEYNGSYEVSFTENGSLYTYTFTMPESDVDLYVDSGLRGLAFFGLLDGVASALEVPVDLIDASQVDRGSRIEREIAQSGVQIYG